MNPPLPIATLIPTQAGLRDWTLARSLAEQVRAGRTFDRVGEKPIEVSVFEDGRRYVHNGHHRVVAVHLAGRAALLPTEYAERAWTYAEYAAWNPTAGWVTPFDPRTEMRVADLTWHRAIIRGFQSGFVHGTDEHYARAHRHLYAIPRYTTTIAGLAPSGHDPRVEALADADHEQWMAWTKHLLAVEPTISAARRAKWEALFVPYADLSEEEKEKDRELARRELAALRSCETHIRGSDERRERSPA